jgi:CHAT domain
MRVTWSRTGQLEIKDVTTTAKRGARRGTGELSTFPLEFLESKRVSIHKTLEVSLPATTEARRSIVLPVVALDIETSGAESALVALRHPSQALTFHPASSSTVRRGDESSSVTLHFRIPLRQSQTAEGRRGIVSETIKATVLKVVKPLVDKIADFALPKLSRLWEEHAWSKKGLNEGWFRVVVGQGNAALQLRKEVPNETERSLLLIHGTFSNATSAFGGLTGTDFFERTRPIYGDRIFAFNHFTVSKSPIENTQALLSVLPDKKQTFDVITHSRGGLVLRTIVEGASQFGKLSDRLQVGQVVLVASPNDGTPLGTPERWEKTVGWVANLSEIVGKFAGENPFLTATEFVSEAIVWLAHHVVGDLPGLRAMDGGGETIIDIQGPPGPPEHLYSALVANFQPDKKLWLRMVDAGVDQFFGGANDLVVPTEGGWRVDRSGGHVDADRIGCFGPGGNLSVGQDSSVIHTTFFYRPETATFLANTFLGHPQNLAAVNLANPLPDHRVFRGGPAAAGADSAPPPVQRTVIAPATVPPATSVPFFPPSTSAADTFHLVILDAQRVLNEGTVLNPTPTDSEKQKVALLYAAYAGARAVEPFGLSGGEAGIRFHEIIRIHEQIKNFTDRQMGNLPSDPEMIRFGTLLFETLFPGEVRRLYDTARSLQSQRDRKLDLVFTSMVSWIAEKPWEFAYDPARKSFLATEEIHFVRNVLTAVPGDPLRVRTGPLRILVVSAQPVGLAELSISQETEVIRRGFQRLIDAKLAEVKVLARATIPSLHGELSTGVWNVVHFIGHGTFDEEQGKGYLVFEDGHGGKALLDERSAREIFCQRGLDLVFLNACQTSEAIPAEFNKGMAQALVAHGVPALVANQYSVLDVSATSFAQFFYWGLARGMTLGEAAREARIAVNYSFQGDSIDWAVPALYARDPNSSLTARADKIAYSAAIVSDRKEQRRQSDERIIRILVWDVDHRLPDLETLLSNLNKAQSRFLFEIITLSPPLDSFETKGDAGKVITYFRADRVARRLQSKASQLRADFLLCITAKPLIDQNNTVGRKWLSPDRNSAVLVLSYADFQQLPPSSPELRLALTSAIVGLLAQALAKISQHSTGSTSCPLYANSVFSPAELKKLRSFDLKCRKMLSRTIPRDLPALDSLLSAFQDSNPTREQKITVKVISHQKPKSPPK